MTNFLKSFLFAFRPGGQYSHTRFWSNVGFLCMTSVFIYFGFFIGLPEWYAWIYACIVVTPNLASKLMKYRYGDFNQTEDDQEPRPKGKDINNE